MKNSNEPNEKRSDDTNQEKMNSSAENVGGMKGLREDSPAGLENDPDFAPGAKPTGRTSVQPQGHSDEKAPEDRKRNPNDPAPSDPSEHHKPDLKDGADL